jgi:uncharacterized iron-regulated protein
LRRLVLSAAALFALVVPALPFELPDWTVGALADHPLVGTIWRSDGTHASPEALQAALLTADHVAVGEIHSNADHHRIQAAVVEALAQAGRRPALVFEMIPERLDDALQAFLAERPSDAAGLGKLLEWEERGWPDWSLYRPIAEAALRHGLAMKAGNLDRSLARAVGQEGRQALGPDRIERYRLDRPLESGLEEALTAELYEGHCRLMPRDALAPMLTVQRATDGALADAMIRADRSAGTVLIAGAGHVREDWGAPAVLEQRLPGAEVLTIALVEVREGSVRFDAYTSGLPGPLPYDFVIFTPRSETGDPCAGLRERLDERRQSTE